MHYSKNTNYSILTASIIANANISVEQSPNHTKHQIEENIGKLKDKRKRYFSLSEKG
jgi:predicted transcriptional regulator